MRKRMRHNVTAAAVICSLILSFTAFGFGGMGRVAAKQSSV